MRFFIHSLAISLSIFCLAGCMHPTYSTRSGDYLTASNRAVSQPLVVPPSLQYHESFDMEYGVPQLANQLNPAPLSNKLLAKPPTV